MKKLFLVILSATGAIAGLIFAYREMSKEKETELEGEKPVFAPSRAKRGTGGELILTLDAETQKRIGLRIEPLAASKLPQEKLGYGRVVDISPLASLVGELATTQAILSASNKELQRVRALRDQGENASARALEAVEAAFQRQQIAVHAIQQRVELAWGKAIAGREDLPDFVHSLVTQEVALLRVDLPAGEWLEPNPTNARVLLSPDVEPTAAKIVGPAPNISPEMQGQAFLLLVNPRPNHLTPGAAVTVLLAQPGEPLHGVAVPREALLRVAGKEWVYVQINDETFARREIPATHPLPSGWFVTSPLAPNDRIVVGGAQTLLSEELKAQIPVLVD